MVSLTMHSVQQFPTGWFEPAAGI